MDEKTLQSAQDLGLPLEEGTPWAGKPTVRCTLCPYSTPGALEGALKHVRLTHPETWPEPEKPKVVVKSKLVAPNGDALFLEVQ